MSCRGIHRSAFSLLILAIALFAVTAWAGDKECDKRAKHPNTVSIEVDDDELILTRSCGDESKVIMVNLNMVEDLVSDALQDVSVILDELDDLQMEIHLGQDNMLSFADEDSEWVLDLDQIAMHVESALRVGLEELDTEHWTSSHSRHADEDDLQDLQDELDSLRRELKRLERELDLRSDRDE